MRGESYPVFIGEPPDPCSHLHGEDDEEEDEELERRGGECPAEDSWFKNVPAEARTPEFVLESADALHS